MLIAFIVVSTILAFAGSVIAGRLAAFIVTAFCGAMMAFFVMPPTFSFRVSQAHDIIVLAFYGTVGLVLAKKAPPRGQHKSWVDPGCDLGSSSLGRTKRVEIDLASAFADLTSSPVGIRLNTLGLPVTVGNCVLPCTRDEALRILSDVLIAAIETPNVQRISICGAQLPTVRLLKVVAHQVYPTPPHQVIIIGKRETDCVAVHFPGWLSRARANWFDNEYERIYQVSIQVDGSDR